MTVAQKNSKQALFLSDTAPHTPAFPTEFPLLLWPFSLSLSGLCKRVVVADLSPVIAGLMSVTRGSERVHE